MTPGQQKIAEALALRAADRWSTPKSLGGERSSGHATQLQRMEAAGEVESRLAEGSAHRLVYRLTEKGRKVLANRQYMQNLVLVQDGPGGSL